MNADASAPGRKAWGLSAAIDIQDCHPETIRDPEAIRRFVEELCERIGMKRFGETQVVHFGEDEAVEGLSMVQFIETSLVSAHFANLSRTAYLDLFSCRLYDADAVAKFARAFFGGSRVSVRTLLRY